MLCGVKVLLWMVVGATMAKSVGKGALQVEVTKEVQCKANKQAQEGDKVTVHYGGFLQDGKKFDSSFDRAQPFTFTMGVGQVIPGWDQGLLGVCAGEERHLVVPAPLAYGDRGAGDVIPPGATLLFDIVIVDVERADTRQEEELKRKQEEDAKRKKKEEEERKRIEEERKRIEAKKREEEKERKRKAEEEERRRIEEEERRQAEEEEIRRKEEKRKQEQQRRKEQQKRREEEERKRVEEEIRRKEELVREEEAKLRRQEEQREQESQRRKEEEEEYKEGEDEYYYYEDYAPESSCEPGELKMQVTHSPGRCGKIARAGDQLTMHYTGKLSSGRKFDSSVDRNKPFQFTLGVGQVIAGWDEGLSGMCVGEKRTLVIPPDLAYGEQGVGAVIPPCSVLVFDVELLEIAN